MKLRSLLFICCIVSSAYAQEIDSLKRLLSRAPAMGRRLELYGELGSAYYRQFPDSALFYTDKGVAEAATAPDKVRDSTYYRFLAVLQNNSAFIHERKGDLYNAILLYEQSIRSHLAAGDTVNVASAYLNLGRLYSEIKEYDLAMSYLTRGRNALRNVDLAAAGKCQLLIGSINRKRGNEEAALNNFFSAIVLFQRDTFYIGVAQAQDAIGEIYFHRKDYPQALEYYRQSLTGYDSLNDLRGLSEAHFHLAQLLQASGEETSAFTHAQQALGYAQQTGYPQNLRDAANLLYVIFSGRGDYQRALDMHVLYKTMSDTLLAQEAFKIAVQEHLKLDYEAKTALLKAEQQKKDALNAEALKRQQLISVISAAGVVLLLGLLFFAVRSYRQKQKANLAISEQKAIIETKNREMTDSINYANRIQQALLSHEQLLDETLPEYFILFRPKDIVSGDFYWATNVQSSGFRISGSEFKALDAELELPNSKLETRNAERFYLAVCDSTGHGVPGSFMSLLNISFLNEAINEKKLEQPDAVFDHVRERLIANLSKDGAQDGMDGVLLYFNSKSPGEIFYAAANNAPLIVRNKQLLRLPADKMPVGKSPKDQQPFTRYSEKLEAGDLLIVYTDGYADQFGGRSGKKFKYRQLDELLTTHSEKPLQELKAILETEFDSWKGELEQVDDVLVFAIRIK